MSCQAKGKHYFSSMIYFRFRNFLCGYFCGIFSLWSFFCVFLFFCIHVTVLAGIENPY